MPDAVYFPAAGGCSGRVSKVARKRIGLGLFLEVGFHAHTWPHGGGRTQRLSGNIDEPWGAWFIYVTRCKTTRTGSVVLFRESALCLNCCVVCSVWLLYVIRIYFIVMEYLDSYIRLF